MEGVWFAFDAATGQPIHQRVKVIDRVEHPPLQPGSRSTIFPSSLGGLNYSPAVVRPEDELHLQRRRRDGRGRRAAEADADPEEAEAPARRRLPRPRRTATSAAPLRAGTTTARSARSTSSTGKRVWKFKTPEPERGGVTTTASGLGFAGGGDGVLRAFDLKTGKVLWTFQTGARSPPGRRSSRPAARSTSRSRSAARRPRRTAARVSQLQVFALGARKRRRAALAARSDAATVRAARRRGGRAAARPHDGRRADRRAARAHRDRRRRAVVKPGRRAPTNRPT